MLIPIGRAVDGWTPYDGAAPPAGDLLALLVQTWPEVVGEENALHSYPKQLIGDALVITTDSPAWSQQLSFLAEHVVVQLRASLPRAGIVRLRFRVGKMPGKHVQVRPGRAAPHSSASGRAPAASTEAAIARFRAAVTARQRAKRDAGWKECVGCGIAIPPGRSLRCVPCRSREQQQQAQAVAQMFYDTPGIAYVDAAAHIRGLTRQTYDFEKRRLLGRWRMQLERVARDGHLSRDGRERMIANSYVLLKTGIPPERIAAATIRNELGDATYTMIYGTER